jgi:ammonia channel protein AmtB
MKGGIYINELLISTGDVVINLTAVIQGIMGVICFFLAISCLDKLIRLFDVFVHHNGTGLWTDNWNSFMDKYRYYRFGSFRYRKHSRYWKVRNYFGI